MDILFVASELAPMVKVGGLADVVGALGKALRLLGHNVTIALPRFPGLEASGAMMARRLTPLSIDMGAGPAVEVTVFDGRLGSGVSLLVLDAPGLYDRPGVYGEGAEDYPDNARRFAVFCRAVVEVVRQRAQSGTPFDVVHAHDWPTAPVPYLMRRAGAELSRSKTVLTIHNLTHQGVFPRDALGLLGLDDSHFSPDALEFYGGVSFLKAGILSAHALTTVSSTYAREIQTPEHGERLDGLLRSRAAQLTGIVNGIDYAVWNPTTDPAVAARYDAEDTSNKGRCKSALLVECGLSVAPERPVLAFVGRMAAQKGVDVLAAALPKILRSDVSVVIAGAGDESLAEALRQAVARAPERAVYLGGATEAVVHRVLAGADAVLVPSRYEPCGLVQLYAQRYGALPVVTRTGGLVDTVVDIDAALETGTGVLIDEATPAALLGGVQRAVAAMLHPRWPALRRRIMRLDLGWDRPARRYAQLYRTV
ncbi:MAG: glycogen synthase GlgA [Polyangiaceae bacterium]